MDANADFRIVHTTQNKVKDTLATLNIRVSPHQYKQNNKLIKNGGLALYRECFDAFLWRSDDEVHRHFSFPPTGHDNLHCPAHVRVSFRNFDRRRQVKHHLTPVRHWCRRARVESDCVCTKG